VDAVRRIVDFLAQGPGQAVEPARLHTEAAALLTRIGDAAEAKRYLREAAGSIESDASAGRWGEVAWELVAAAPAAEECASSLNELMIAGAKEPARRGLARAAARGLTRLVAWGREERVSALLPPVRQLTGRYAEVREELAFAEGLMLARRRFAEGDIDGSLASLRAADASAEDDGDRLRAVYGVAMQQAAESARAGEGATVERLARFIREGPAAAVPSLPVHVDLARVLALAGKAAAAEAELRQGLPPADGEPEEASAWAGAAWEVIRSLPSAADASAALDRIKDMAASPRLKRALARGFLLDPREYISAGDVARGRAFLEAVKVYAAGDPEAASQVKLLEKLNHAHDQALAGRHDLAIAALRTARGLGDQRWATRLAYTMALAHARRRAERRDAPEVEKYIEYLRTGPGPAYGEPELHADVGLLLQRLGRKRQAEDELVEAAMLADAAGRWGKVQALLIALTDPEPLQAGRAIFDKLERVIRSEEGLKTFACLKARFLARRYRPEEAEELLGLLTADEATRAQERVVGLAYAVADSYARSKQLEKAQEAFARAEELSRPLPAEKRDKLLEAAFYGWRKRTVNGSGLLRLAEADGERLPAGAAEGEDGGGARGGREGAAAEALLPNSRGRRSERRGHRNAARAECEGRNVPAGDSFPARLRRRHAGAEDSRGDPR